ncbi:MAG: succinate dehydrogenase, cytochrome b556 subunit [Pseudomonadota bacterium]
MADNPTVAKPGARPLSPHLQIWRFTVTMAASITHRGTGIANAGGILLVLLWALALSVGGAFYDAVSGFFASPLGFVICVGYIWTLSFHLLNGLRHLYWDTGRGLAPKTASLTAWAVYLGSAAMAIVFISIAGGQ